ncbi:MAG: methyl-accepting chemotaxis protein, partial [Oceanisphaera sp.]|nr:methyl-accepting chemotaxis protein [Oceanisphaera sp.]
MLRQLKIGPRSIISFGLLGAITLLLGMIAIVQFGNIGREVDLMAHKRTPAAIKIGEIRRDFLQIRLYTLNALYADNEQSRRDAVNRLEDLEHSFQTNIREMKAYVESDEGKQLLGNVVQSKADYDAVHNRLLAMINGGQLAQAEQFRHQGFNELGIQVTTELNNLGSYQTQRADEEAAAVDDIIDTSNFIMVLAIILALLLVVTLALLFSRSLLQPIRKALEICNVIASGNLTSEFGDDARDEAADMIRALARMQQKLKQTIFDINDSATQLASTAEQLSVVTDQSTRALQQQSDELEQAATAV